MPCNQVVEVSVSLESADPVLIREILADLALPIRFEQGQLKGSQWDLTRGVVAVVKRAYAARVIQKAVKKFGWKQSQQGQKITLRR